MLFSIILKQICFEVALMILKSQSVSSFLDWLVDVCIFLVEFFVVPFACIDIVFSAADAVCSLVATIDDFDIEANNCLYIDTIKNSSEPYDNNDNAFDDGDVDLEDLKGSWGLFINESETRDDGVEARTIPIELDGSSCLASYERSSTIIASPIKETDTSNNTTTNETNITADYKEDSNVGAKEGEIYSQILLDNIGDNGSTLTLEIPTASVDCNNSIAECFHCDDFDIEANYYTSLLADDSSTSNTDIKYADDDNFQEADTAITDTNSNDTTTINTTTINGDYNADYDLYSLMEIGYFGANVVAMELPRTAEEIRNNPIDNRKDNNKINKPIKAKKPSFLMCILSLFVSFCFVLAFHFLMKSRYDIMKVQFYNNKEASWLHRKYQMHNPNLRNSYFIRTCKYNIFLPPNEGSHSQ